MVAPTRRKIRMSIKSWQRLTVLHRPSAATLRSHLIFPESYRTLKMPDDTVDLIDIENQREVLANNFKVRNELMVLLNNMEYILLSAAENHDEFEEFDIAAMTADRKRLADDFDRIVKEASACMRDATQCHLATFSTPTHALPRRKASAVPQVAGCRLWCPSHHLWPECPRRVLDDRSTWFKG